ncbi:invasion associated locus B family protein [Roseovarius spongiae]|nr:invasion associated locus B family protein [Roseovarius spongiae]
MFPSAKTILVPTLCAALAWPGLAAAQDKPAEEQENPTHTTETFGDWQVDCIVPVETEENAERRDRQCEMRTQVTRREEDGTVRPLIQTGIGQTGMEEGFWMVIQTPLGLLLQEGVKLRLIDDEVEGDPEPMVTARFLYCERTHCRSQALLNAAQMDALGAADEVEVQFVGIPDVEYDIPLSMEGFADARAALSE